MRGYRRPGPEFTWYCWWGAMLIANDDVPTEEELRAEDEAIARMERGESEPQEGTFTLPDSLAHLVRSDDDDRAVQQGQEA